MWVVMKNSNVTSSDAVHYGLKSWRVQIANIVCQGELPDFLLFRYAMYILIAEATEANTWRIIFGHLMH